jgi:hypothetical protein
MQKLLLATPRLERLYYSYGYYNIGPESLTASELITLLNPLINTPEDLYLELLHPGLEGDDRDERNLIYSLAHFTTLRRLYTNVDVWRMLSDLIVSGKYGYLYTGPIEDDDRLCLRLPPSLKYLCLHTTGVITDPKPRQIQDLILWTPIRNISRP